MHSKDSKQKQNNQPTRNSASTTPRTPLNKKDKAIHTKKSVNNKIDRALKIEQDLKKKNRTQLISRLRDTKFSLQSSNSFQTENIPLILKDNEYAIKLIEDLGFLILEISWSTTKKQVFASLLSFIRHRYQASLTNLVVTHVTHLQRFTQIKDQFTSIFMTELQSQESPFGQLRSVLDNYVAIRDTPIMKKMHKFMMYALSLNLFTTLGINFDTCHYNSFEAEAIKRKYFVGPDFIHTMCDTFLFIAERGYQCVKTGTMDPIYHSGSTYEDWYVTSLQLLRDSNFMTNPAPHGLNRHKFLSELRDAIEKGDAIYKYTVGSTPSDKKLVGKVLNDLKMCLSNEITKRSAQRERKAPFAVLICGGSSVGKSNFSSMLFKHYAKLFQLPEGSEYKYTRNHSDDFWSAFDSTQWCIQMDDIAFMNPNIAQGGGDPSIIEMIKVVNNVPFIPAQADLADKGRTPMLAQLVLATTNVPSLNAHAYFACPLALRRRLPFVITLKVKACYSKDVVMLDPSKIPPLREGDYPDLWEIVVSVVEPRPSKPNEAQLKELNVYTNVYEFLVWFNTVAKQHEFYQQKSTEVVSVIELANLCSGCSLPISHCICGTPEQEDYSAGISLLSAPSDNSFSNVGSMSKSSCGIDCLNCCEDSEFCDCWKYCSVCQLTKRACKCPLGSTCLSCSQNDCLCSGVSLSPIDFDTLELQANDITPVSTYQYTQTNPQSANVLHRKPWWLSLIDAMIYIALDNFVPSSLSIPFRLFGVFVHIMTLLPTIHEYLVTYLWPVWWFKVITHMDNWITFILYTFIHYIPIMLFLVIYKFRRIYFSLMYLLNFYRRYRNLSDDYTEARRRMRVFGERINNQVGKIPEKYKLPGAVLTAVTAGTIIHMIFKYLQTTKDEEFLFTDTHIQAKPEIGQNRPQGNDKVENVWYKNDFVLTPFCTTDLTKSYAALSDTKVHEVILRNCVSLRSRVVGSQVSRPTKAICIGGNVYLANNHGIPDTGALTVTITSMSSKDGVSSNVEVGLKQSQILRYPKYDICIFTVLNLPPRKDITRLFQKVPIKGTFDGYYLSRNEQGCTLATPISRIQLFDNLPIRPLDIACDVWMGATSNLTNNGDCGSVLVAHTNTGPIILGIHIIGSLDFNVGAISVTHDMLQQFKTDLTTPIIQSGLPIFDSSDCGHTLGSLHPKSTFRYIESGTAEVHGSFLGHRPNTKTNVCPTAIRDAAVANGYPVLFGPPMVKGWLPWRKSLIDMVKPRPSFDQDILDKLFYSRSVCIQNTLPKGQLEEIMVYDNFTAINGAASVKFVDKMNRNTSMGFPWNKSKQYYMHSIPPVGDLLDPVNFTAEVLDRADNIIKTYLAGSRHHPIFQEQLKDEPRLLEKAKNGSTRLFSTAPADWSLVGRRFYLSIIRVIQNNKYIFGAAPGTAAQSIEWHYMYSYVTKFGKDRIIAGDYKAFDKTMSPVIILLAFKRLIWLAELAGYTPDEIQIMLGIAVDTAYPTINFNGCLATFFGTNPSGHILTVIINCEANQIYLRYAFYKLRPLGCDHEFDDVVALMTYGDDYVGSVSDSVPWYNHATITEVLKELDITHTLPDKTNNPSVKYLHIRDTAFLKRKWLFCEDTGTYLCPLDEESIAKMLTTCVMSKTITRNEQALEVLMTACQEYFFYGKIIFQQKRNLLQKIADESDLGDYLIFLELPTWDELLERYQESSLNILKPTF